MSDVYRDEKIIAKCYSVNIMLKTCALKRAGEEGWRESRTQEKGYVVKELDIKR